MLLRARHYRTNQVIDVQHEAGRIIAIAPGGQRTPDRQSEFLAPAFFDLQVNGCHGHSFNSPDLTIEQVGDVIGVCRRHGIGGLLPTLVTNSFEALRHGFITLSHAREHDARIACMVPGFHLEGPYLSGDDGPRGAHPKSQIRNPDWEEFARWQEAARGLIKLVTLAPEKEGALPFIERLVKSGVVAAIGHTAATPATIRDAISAGATLSTHLGNGSHALLPRHDNYLWEQLAADELWASVITDGHHLPASMVKVIVRIKTPARTIITCDASSLAGLAPGCYAGWGTELEVLPGGKVVLPGTPFLAGSGLFTDQCVANLRAMTGVSLGDAIDMAGARPRELLGLPAADLLVGATTPLILFDLSKGELHVRELID